MSAEQKKAELDDECCICGGEYDPESGGVQGYFGISVFLEICYFWTLDAVFLLCFTRCS